MRLLLVRHGATLNNLEKCYTGQTDVPLNPVGERQAAAVAEFLAPDLLSAVVASDLSRARETARAIARHHALPVQEDADLREMSLGTWEGMPYAEVATQQAALLRSWQTDPVHYAPPGGETALQVRDRVVRALQRWREACQDEGTIVWALHGGTIGILLCHLLGMELQRRNQFRIENASITELLLGSRHATLTRLNETTHLRSLETPQSNGAHVHAPTNQPLII